MNPKIHPQARLDQKRQFEYLRKAHVGAPTLHKFIDAIREAKSKIGDHPTRWNYVPGSRRVRRFQVRTFRMQVFYIILPDSVPFIVEIAGPGAQPRWTERL